MVRLTHIFQTEFHKELASEAWLLKFSEVITERLKAFEECQLPSGSGWIYWQGANKDKYGESDETKYWFGVRVDLDPSEKSDALYEASVTYMPVEDDFTVRYEQLHTKATRKLDARNHKLLEQVKKALENGGSLEEFDLQRCPWCQSKLDIMFSEDGLRFWFDCDNCNRNRGLNDGWSIGGQIKKNRKPPKGFKDRGRIEVIRLDD